MTVLADGKDLTSIDELEARFTGCMTRVARHAWCLDGPVFVNGMVGIPAPLDGLLFLYRPPQDRVVAPFALLVPELEAHSLRLLVPPDQEANGIEASHSLDPKSHRKVGPAVAVNTAERRFGVVVGAGQVPGGRGPEAGELFLVEMAGDTEAVVPVPLGEGP